MSTFVAITPHTYEVVITMLEDDWSLQQTADAVGMTREAVRHIAEQKFGGTVITSDPGDYRAPAHIQLIRDVAERVLNHIMVHLDRVEPDSVLTVEQVAAAFPQVSRSHVMAAIRDAQLEPLMYDATTESRERFSDDMIYTALRTASLTGAGALSGDQYDAWAKDRPKGMVPSRSLIIHRFGTWSSACSAAGVQVVVRKERGWSQTAMWGALHKFAEDMMHADQPLTFGGYSEWARQQTDSVPSGSTLKARLFQTTPWSEVRIMLIQHLYRWHGHRWVRATPPIVVPDSEAVHA